MEPQQRNTSADTTHLAQHLVRVARNGSSRQTTSEADSIASRGSLPSTMRTAIAPDQNVTPVVCHTFLPWFLGRLFIVFAFGAFCLEQAVRTRSILWWIALIAVALVGVATVQRYTCGALICEAQHLVFIQWRWSYTMQRVSLATGCVQIDQNWLGRLLGYATIYYVSEGVTCIAHNVALCPAIRTLHDMYHQRDQDFYG